MNADLVELPPLVRLLFIGLWTIADREGRLEDRPAQIKMQVLPGDELDTVQALCMLGAKKFLRQYKVGGCAYIEICKFKKHQNPHKAEQPSVIPPPPVEPELPIITDVNSNTIPASCKHRACLVLAGLIPDSRLLIPDSMIPEKGGGKKPSPDHKETKVAVKRFIPPTPDEVGEYMLEIGYQGNPQQFCDYYITRGWMIGKNKMKDWKAAVRTWRSNGYERSIQSGGGAAATGAKKGSVTQADDTVKPPGYFAGDFPDRSSEW